MPNPNAEQTRKARAAQKKMHEDSERDYRPGGRWYSPSGKYVFGSDSQVPIEKYFMDKAHANKAKKEGRYPKTYGTHSEYERATSGRTSNGTKAPQ